jgi:hypothetical protein
MGKEYRMLIEIEISVKAVFLSVYDMRLREIHCEKETRGGGWELGERKIW